MAISFRAASGGQSSTAALSAPVTQPAGAVAGDLVLVAINIKNSTSDTFAAQAGWTLSSQDANAFNGTSAFKSAVYWRVLDGTESWPVSFSWASTTAKFAWNAIAFAPGAGNTIAIDGEAAVKIDTAGASTHTANAQTAAAASVCSVVINCGRTSATGATAITVTPPASWTEPANADQSTASGTTAALSQLGVESCYRLAQSGTVAPGASTWSQSTVAANVYHFLLAELVPETSPALELSGFAVPSPPVSVDTVNSVTVAVTEHQSSAAQAAATFQLWDGTTAQIGATATGTASVSTSNVSSAAFTGVSFSQLATLRVRVFGNANSGSGFTESVDAVSLSVNYTPAPGGRPPAAAGSGAAQGATVSTVPSTAAAAGLAPANGAAQFTPGTSVSVDLIADSPVTAAGTALNATVSTAAGATAAAVPASGAGTARQPSLAAAASVTAGLASGAGTAQGPAVTAAAAPAAALAAGTGAAQNPGAAAAVPAAAGLASGAGTARNATAGTSAAGTANAVLASGAGTAQPPAAAAAVNAGAATGTGSALNPAVTVSGSANANAGLAGGTGTAPAPVPAAGVRAGTASGAGAALTAGHGAVAGLAGGSAAAPAAVLAAAAQAAAARALAAALGATGAAVEPFTVGVLTSSVSSGINGTAVSAPAGAARTSSGGGTAGTYAPAGATSTS